MGIGDDRTLALVCSDSNAPATPAAVVVITWAAAGIAREAISHNMDLQFGQKILQTRHKRGVPIREAVMDLALGVAVHVGLKAFGPKALTWLCRA